MSLLLTILSTIVGIVYTVAWSLSFWFQSIGVWRVKSAEGLSINFLIMNFVGFYFSVRCTEFHRMSGFPDGFRDVLYLLSAYYI